MVEFAYGRDEARENNESPGLFIRLVRGGALLESFASELDSTPNSFNPGTLTNVPLNSVSVSNPITVSGMSAGAITGIGVSGAPSSRYSINSTNENHFTSVPGAVKQGDVVRVRHLNVTLPNATTSTVLTIGGVTGTFSSTTRKLTQATLTVNATPSSIPFSGTSTLSTSGGSGNGAVSYAVATGGAFCAISGNTLTGVGVGTCSVTATKAGNGSYEPAMSAAIPITVTKAQQATLTAHATPSTIPIGSTSTLSTTGGSGAGAVSYSVLSGAAFCSRAGNIVTGIAAGNCGVMATKAGDVHYESASSSVQITVTGTGQGPGIFANGFEAQ